MKAIRISKHGSLDVLKVDDIEIPKCNSDEVLINI
ncbi:MAG: zinc-binding dehydrogenase, partial [Candidatus Marinimicrobia bacterium]|nr:zinc-binding dehydrogenase [Candidatus Neomarinimicrobiota bacterium]